MLIYAILNRLYLATSAYLKDFPCIKSLLVTSRKLVRLPLVSMLLLLFITSVHSQENNVQQSLNNTEIQYSAEKKLLKQAESFRLSDLQKSIQWANKALKLAQNNNNPNISAQAHSLLGELAKTSGRYSQSIDNFSQAAIIYRKISDKRNYILSSINYIDALYLGKRYQEGDNAIEELLNIVDKNGEESLIAFPLLTKANDYSQQKDFINAIEQYTQALKYLSGNDKTIQRQRAETFTKIAVLYKRINNKEETASFYEKALNTYNDLGDQKQVAITLHALAEVERSLHNYLVALEHSTRGLEIHKTLDDPAGRIKALIGVGIVYRLIGSYQKSLTHIHEAYIYYKELDDIGGMAITSNQMGLIYSRLNQFEQAKSFFQVTINLPKTKIKSKDLASAYREMAKIELDAHNYELAKVMVGKAYTIYKNNNNKLKQSLSTKIIADIYRAELNFVTAITYYRESLALATEVGNTIYQIKALTPLAAMLIDIDTDEAMVLLNKSLSMATQINSTSHMMYATRELRKTEKKRGNYLASLQHAEEEIALTKIIQKDLDNEELDVAKAILYSHKIEMELVSLQEKTEQSRKISELERMNDRYVYMALTSLLIICLFAVLFLYRRFIHSRKLNKKLGSLATTDPLTDCYNRRFLLNFLNRDFADTELLDEYCIIMADIDRFKTINDNYGHSTGDTVICGIADIFKDKIRKSDIVARYGGEEFCLVLPSATPEKALQIAEVMRQQIESSQFNNINVTCSFGVTSIKLNALSPTELIDQADLALYKSKNSGRNRVTLWDKTL